MRKLISITSIILALFLVISCSTKKKDVEKMKFTGIDSEVKLMTLDPGHFHAALVQKSMYKQVSPVVYVFAPEGPDVQDHLERIAGFNSRAENPTDWEEKVYTGSDFFKKMIHEKPGNVVVLSGNNEKKTEYIKANVAAGINVLADKPMAINFEDFELLKETFALAEKNGVLLYDIMTERFSITSVLQKKLSLIPELFGELQKGSPEKPAVTKESVHHFYKYVAGSILKRPAWFFDVDQQGEGLVDITTHLVDLVQWECFPEQILDYQKDIEIITAKRWPTLLTANQFKNVTHLSEYPDFLKKDIKGDNLLHVYSNGEIVYKIKGIHAKVSVIWNYQAPESGGDTHFSIMRGGKANLVIRQGEEQNYFPQLFIEPVESINLNKYEESLKRTLDKITLKYPGLDFQKLGKKWQVGIPEKYRIGHEAHFRQVTEKYLQYLIDGKLPDWETPNMLAKYYTTTSALQKAKTE